MPTAKDPVAQLAKLIRAAGPLALELVEEDDPARRVELRERVGQETIFELNNLMTALCSERVRSESQWGKKPWPSPLRGIK